MSEIADIFRVLVDVDEQPIVLGATYEDTVTGAVGVLTGVAVHLHAAPDARVESLVDGTRLVDWLELTRIRRISAQPGDPGVLP